MNRLYINTCGNVQEPADILHVLYIAKAIHNVIVVTVLLMALY